MDCNPASAGGHHHIIVVVEYFMKLEEVMPTIKDDGETTSNSYSIILSPDLVSQGRMSLTMVENFKIR